MGSTVSRIPTRRPNVALQALALQRDFPGSTVHLGPGRLSWIGKLKPSPLSDTHTVQIDYRGSGRPVVTVLSPKLVAPEGRRLPHVFPGDHPCLNFPGEWTADMLIASTVVPWASEWLLHYEIWRATGTWTGGGHEPSQGPKRDSADADQARHREPSWSRPT